MAQMNVAALRRTGTPDPSRGSQHDVRIDQLPPEFLEELARASAIGAADFAAGRYITLEQLSARIHGE